jgi:hypothetical protein
MNNKEIQQDDDYGFFYDLEEYDHDAVHRKKDNSHNRNAKKKDDDDCENEKKFYQRINRYVIFIGIVINVVVIFAIWR